MTTPAPEPSQSVSAVSVPDATPYRAGPRDLVLGVLIGALVSVAVLLPAAISAFGGGDILPALNESGLTVVLILLAIVVVIWAVVDGFPAWRNRTPRASAVVTP